MSASASRPVTVLYIAGYGRSGSTLLGKLLGELDRVAYVGELNFFWSDGILGDRPCGCGAALSDCPRWSRVITRLGPDPRDTAREVVELLAHTTRLRHGLAASAATRYLEPRQQRLRHHLGTLYRAVAEEFNADIIVDSSKSPTYGRILDGIENLNLNTIQLVRDPRAVADSWRRPKREPVGVSVLPRIGLVRSSLLWTVMNQLAYRYWPPDGTQHLVIRYEDLMARPNAILAPLATALGHDPTTLDVDTDRCITLGVSHSIAGNPGRFDTGRIALQLDDSWRTRVSRRDYALTTTLTLPALRSFGYTTRRGQR